jgi:hypothetical protein
MTARPSETSLNAHLGLPRCGGCPVNPLIGIAAVRLLVAQLPLTNFNRKVATHAQAYVQANQIELLGFYADYQSGDRPHKAATTTEICGNAVLLDPSELPPVIATFVAANC